MQTNNLNTIPIIQYINQVKAADLSKQKEVRISIENAKLLAFTLGEVMARLEGDLESLLISKTSNSDEVIEIKIDAGGNW